MGEGDVDAMNSNLLLALALAAILLLSGHARAQAPSPLGQGDHHPLHRDFYRHWMQPGVSPPVSCCNARIEQQGVEVGDCEPTEARLIAGRWYARLPHAGPFVEVPESRILRERNPTQDGTDAHLCWSPVGGVLCFVPPFGGG